MEPNKLELDKLEVKTTESDQRYLVYETSGYISAYSAPIISDFGRTFVPTGLSVSFLQEAINKVKKNNIKAFFSMRRKGNKYF